MTGERVAGRKQEVSFPPLPSGPRRRPKEHEKKKREKIKNPKNSPSSSMITCDIIAEKTSGAASFGRSLL